MMRRAAAIRLYKWVGTAVAFGLIAAPAAAQYKPQPVNNPSGPENYHIEVGGDLWFPSSDITVASAGTGVLAGLPGSQINAERDLGVTDTHFPALQVILKPAKKHKFRLNYVPISFVGDAVLKTSIDFNGIRYQVGVPVNSTMKWDEWRFGYEYDFVSTSSGFAGFILEAKYTNVRVELDSPFASEFAQARAPIPAIGGIGRVYVAPSISITGEVAAFAIPNSIDSRYQGHDIDIDIYGTVNFTPNIGVKGGFRSMDVGYLIKTDSGSMTLRGLYFGAVLRY
ncbi:MAG TPA: hypothetical protein VGH34_17005 [Vicinamibacterales bacterium]|jgi:hypothetical protein